MTTLIDRLDSAKAAELYAAGCSLKQIGEELDASDGSIRNLLIRDGVPIRPRGGARHAQHKQLIHRVVKGPTP